MRYLCQVWIDGKALDALPPAEKKQIDRDSLAHDAALEKAGQLVIAQAIQSPEHAVTVRVRDGRMSATDGPFIETKEFLGGFVLVEARDLNEALRIASEIPLAKYGAIEVRPIYEIPDPDA